MCGYKYLERIILLAVLSILTSCAEGNPEGRPSLNADDLWDQMAEERQKPLLDEQENSQNSDSREILSDSPPVAPSAPLSNSDIDEYEASLRAADDKYQAISGSLGAGFAALAQAGGTARDRQDEWRTMQLYLSRLTNLRKTMDHAITILVGVAENDFDDPRLIAQGRDLLAVVTDRITDVRRRLDDLSPSE